MIVEDIGRRAACAAVALLCLPCAGAAETVRYQYDALGRLTRVETAGGPAAGTVTTYAFDATGNRTSVSVTGAPEAVNASFEAPAVGNGYQYGPSAPAGMTFAGASGVAGNGSAWGFADAPNGSQVAFVQGGNNATGTITQTVNGLTAGNQYEVRFWASSRPGYAQTSIGISVDGSPKGVFSMGFAFAPYRSSVFTAQGSTATVVFTTALMAPDSASGVDLVTVVPR